MYIVSRIRQASSQRADDGDEDEEPRDGRVGEARGDHCLLQKWLNIRGLCRLPGGWSVEEQKDHYSRRGGLRAWGEIQEDASGGGRGGFGGPTAWLIGGGKSRGFVYCQRTTFKRFQRWNVLPTAFTNAS